MKGRTPGKLTELQVAQKQVSRDMILVAARKLFGTHSYIDMSVDDIAKKAGISRKTFYKHFTNKLEVASCILEFYLEKMIDDYASLGATSAPDKAAIVAWIERIIAIWRKSRRQMAVLSSLLRQDPQLIAHRARTYEVTIARLGSTIPAFRYAATEGSQEARIKAHLLLLELEDLCYELVISGWRVDEQLAVSIVADHFLQFFETQRS